MNERVGMKGLDEDHVQIVQLVGTARHHKVVTRLREVRVA